MENEEIKDVMKKNDFKFITISDTKGRLTMDDIPKIEDMIYHAIFDNMVLMFLLEDISQKDLDIIKVCIDVAKDIYKIDITVISLADNKDNCSYHLYDDTGKEIHE